MNNKRYYPLTHPQKGIWYTEKFYPGTGIANVIGSIRLQEGLDFEILKKTVNMVIANNDGLRLRICEQPTGPVQYVSDHYDRDFLLADFSAAEDSETSYLQWIEEQRSFPIPVNDSDLFEFVFFKLAEGKGGLYLKAHHTIADAWTMILLGNQINDYYFRLLDGSKPITSYSSSYIEYIKDEQKFCASHAFQVNRRFWNNIFKTIPELTTLRPNKQAFGSCKANRKSLSISRELTTRLNQFVEEMVVSLFVLMLSSLAVCLHKILDRDDIIIGTPLLNRLTIKEKTTVGMFIETIPVRLSVDESMSFDDFVNYVAQSWNEMRHHRYPYNLLLEDIRKIHKLNTNLYDIMLSFQNARFDLNLAFQTSYIANGSEANSLCFHISDRDNLGELFIDADYQVDLFSEEEIETLCNCVFNILDTAIRNPTQKIADISLVSKKEKQYLLKNLNDTYNYYPDNALVHSLFEEQVMKTPFDIAFEFQEENLTYRELNQRANRLARLLQTQGVRPGSIVSLLLDRSVDLAVSLWAILKTGGAYLPLDPNYPQDRILYILEDSQSMLVLTQQSLQAKINNAPCLLVDQIDLDHGDGSDLGVPLSSSGLAYVLYTSGSTGRPKGVMIEHRSVCNFFTAMTEQIKLENKRVLSVTTVCFDIFVFEFFLPLVNGNTVVMADEEQQLVPMELSRLISDKKIHIVQTTPSRMNLLLMDDNCQSSLANITDIVLGGEVFPLALLEKLKKTTSARIINGYGPTEATVYATFKDLTHDNYTTIGRPLANTRAYILDKKQHLLPVNITGELYLGGAGLARGYINQEKLTGERFILSPFHKKERLYRTGDLARWNNQGEIEFFGRADYQVKVRGYRIELGEIENTLLKHGQIEEAAVINREDSNQEQYLCAFLKVQRAVSIAEIRSFLSKELPEYMIPAAYILLDEMPLNVNGKIDRRHLATFESEITLIETDYVEPRNKEESILAEEWGKVLNRDKIGIDDNFFNIGGDSLKIVKTLVALMPYKWELTARDFYKYQTIRKLAEKISGGAVISYEENDFLTDIASVPELKKSTAVSRAVNMQNILLTGATGFLGAHLLKDLLVSTNANIYCIVRGKSKSHAVSRLKQILEFYFPDRLTHEIGKRIKVVHGDITEARWGLSAQQYNQLQKFIDNVFHAAAIVSHYGSYVEFEKTNVLATGQIVDFCINTDKMFHYISSISVSGKYLVAQDQENTSFSENDFFIGQHYYENVYVRSKFEAENLILKATHAGLRATIYRLGVLAGRFSDGNFQININDNGMYNRIRSIILTEVIPEDFIDLEMELTPVDYCSRAIALLSGATSNQGKIFHLFNHNTFSLPKLIKAADLCGYDVKVKKGKSFDTFVQNIYLNPIKRDLLTGIINDVNINKTSGISEYPVIVSAATQKQLKKLGFIWPKPDIPYLVKIIKYMELVGFISNTDEIMDPA